MHQRIRITERWYALIWLFERSTALRGGVGIIDLHVVHEEVAVGGRLQEDALDARRFIAQRGHDRRDGASARRPVRAPEEDFLAEAIP